MMALKRQGRRRVDQRDNLFLRDHLEAVLEHMLMEGEMDGMDGMRLLQSWSSGRCRAAPILVSQPHSYPSILSNHQSDIALLPT